VCHARGILVCVRQERDTCWCVLSVMTSTNVQKTFISKHAIHSFSANKHEMARSNLHNNI
jgi:hypothetical protein